MHETLALGLEGGGGLPVGLGVCLGGRDDGVGRTGGYCCGSSESLVLLIVHELLLVLIWSGDGPLALTVRILKDIRAIVCESPLIVTLDHAWSLLLLEIILFHILNYRGGTQLVLAVHHHLPRIAQCSSSTPRRRPHQPRRRLVRLSLHTQKPGAIFLIRELTLNLLISVLHSHLSHPHILAHDPCISHTQRRPIRICPIPGHNTRPNSPNIPSPANPRLPLPPGNRTIMLFMGETVITINLWLCR